MRSAVGMPGKYAILQIPDKSHLECARLGSAFARGDLSPPERASSAPVSREETPPGKLDGDKSPVKSGDKSPHSMPTATWLEENRPLVVWVGDGFGGQAI